MGYDNNKEYGMQAITAVVVNYNTPDMLKEAIESIRAYYTFEIIVIDGSEIPVNTDETVYHFKKNIGHGKGMNIGITLADTDKVLLFDTDIILNEPCIEDMLDKFNEQTYGVGEVNKLKGGEPCLHPYFQIISKKQYLRHIPYVHSGAPTMLTAMDLYSKGESWRLRHFPVKEYVRHYHNGTLQRVDSVEHYKTQILAKDYFG